MPPRYKYTNPTKSDALKAALASPAMWIKSNPDKSIRLATNYALPFAGATLAGPFLSMLPLGPLGPLLGILAATFARFKFRQNVAGTYYALLHAAGMAGIWGQVVSLLSFMSLGIVGGPTGQALQDSFSNLVMGTGNLQAPAVGLTLSLLANLTGWFGILPGMLGGSSVNALVNEVRALAMYQSMSWGVTGIGTMPRKLVASLWGDRISRLLRIKDTGEGKTGKSTIENGKAKDVKEDDRKRSEPKQIEKKSWAGAVVKAMGKQVVSWNPFWSRQPPVTTAAAERLDEWEVIADTWDADPLFEDNNPGFELPGTFPDSYDEDDTDRMLLEANPWDNIRIFELDNDEL